MDFKQTKQLAEQGIAVAQCNLGYMYSKGEGVAQDKLQAVEWYRKAAEQGHARAQFNLGVMYENGHGVEQNLQTAKEYYGKACDNGLQAGCDAYRRLNEQGC